MIQPRIVALSALAALAPTLAGAWQSDDFSAQGFASQGAVISAGNGVLGSDDDLSTELWEAGLGGRWEPHATFGVSGQLLARDAGPSDNGSLRTDFLFADWRYWTDAPNALGVRLGRVKNPLGLFNSTRDVIFTRPSILLPSSVYSDTLGFRDILFSSDGAQLYGRHALPAGEVSWTLSTELDGRVSSRTRRSLFGAFADQIKPEVERQNIGNVRIESAGARLVAALTWLELDVDFSGAFSGSLNTDSAVLSGQYNGRHLSVTAEYRITETRFGGMPDTNSSDGIYVQLDGHLAPGLRLYTRGDFNFIDRNDRDGRRAVASGGTNVRHTRFSRDITVGLAYVPQLRWGVWGEFHVIDGTGGYRIENEDAGGDRYWTMALVMAGFRF